MTTKIKSRSELSRICAQLRDQGKRVVFTNGCFDLLHVGHLHCLRAAKAEGDILIVAINSDASIKSIKGEKKPLIPQQQRAQIIAALEMVDYVVIFEEPDPKLVITELLPQVLVKGGDWATDKIIGRDVVIAHGGRVISIPPLADISTTRILNSIKGKFC